jgi:hypothetical protein
MRLHERANKLAPYPALPLHKLRPGLALALALVHTIRQHRNFFQRTLERIISRLGMRGRRRNKVVQLTNTINTYYSKGNKVELTSILYLGILWIGNSRYPSKFNCECRGCSLHRFKNCFIRFR